MRKFHLRVFICKRAYTQLVEILGIITTAIKKTCGNCVKMGTLNELADT